MRTAANVFIVLSMIFLCWIIVPLIVGICALVQINDETRKPTTAMSVVTLLFCNLIAGVLMLCMDESQDVGRCNSAFLCDKCKKMDYHLTSIAVNTYLGTVNQHLCPQCLLELKGVQSIMSKPSGQCECCYAYNSRVKAYNVNTSNGKSAKMLCIKCKSRFDIEE